MYSRMLRRSRIIVSLLASTILWGLGWAYSQAYAQTQHQKQAQKQIQDPFRRPEPTRPIQPQIPHENRNQPGKVFLERADSLYTTSDFGRTDRQIVKGNVEFRQGGMTMTCDSAYYYPERNSMDAFGNVRMVQPVPGGTRRGFADVVFYDGDAKLARLRTRGHQQVKLQDPRATLVSDSIDYSMIPGSERGWYDHGGHLDATTKKGDHITITSVHGVYTPGTDLAEFDEDVVLRNPTPGRQYTLRSQRLLYNTGTGIASIETPTEIEGQGNTVWTSHGQYDTGNDNALLDSRSTIVHLDTAGNAVTLVGDSLLFDNATGISRAYSYRDPNRDAAPVILTDTAHHTILTGGYGYYDNVNRVSLAADYPLLREFSTTDTLQLRADTIRAQVLTRMVLTPERRDSLLRIFADSIAAVEALPDSLRSQAPRPDPGATGLATGVGRDVNRDLQMAGLIAPILTEQQKFLARVDSSLLIPEEYYLANAYHRARFFRPDIQGVADSMAFSQNDTLLHMHRRPVVWSGERQVAGNQITVHFNDSTADWALLPDYGIMSEHVADEFYNQLAGRRLFARFHAGELERMEADGNVMTIFLPADKDTTFGKNDTTYNKLVDATSAYLTIDMAPDRKLGKLKMWPDVSGTVTPIFQVRKDQLYLPGFEILETIRPRRDWYPDGTARWADELGDVPDDLEIYLKLPPLKGGASPP